MNLFRVNFQELYQRHLCRHGHFGINVLHLIAVLGIYLALFGIAGWCLQFFLPDSIAVAPVLLSLTCPWLLIVLFHVPARVSVATAACVVLLAGLWAMLPVMPIWVWLLTIPVMHRFQQWSHSVYHMQRDMSRFHATYPRGPLLFVVLLVYELPILLNYLVFGRSDWVCGRQDFSETTPHPRPSFHTGNTRE